MLLPMTTDPFTHPWQYTAKSNFQCLTVRTPEIASLAIQNAISLSQGNYVEYLKIESMLAVEVSYHYNFHTICIKVKDGMEFNCTHIGSEDISGRSKPGILNYTKAEDCSGMVFWFGPLCCLEIN